MMSEFYYFAQKIFVYIASFQSVGGDMEKTKQLIYERTVWRIMHQCLTLTLSYPFRLNLAI